MMRKWGNSFTITATAIRVTLAVTILATVALIAQAFVFQTSSSSFMSYLSSPLHLTRYDSFRVQRYLSPLVSLSGSSINSSCKDDNRFHDPFRIRKRQSNRSLGSRLFMERQQQPGKPGNGMTNGNNNELRGLLQILNDEVTELLLERLSQKANNNQINNKNNKINKPQPKQASTTDGLSKFHRNILATTTIRQRCVTGKYPLRISITENPTRKWLLSSSSSASSPSSRTSTSTSKMLVNGTSIDRSIASFDRYQWLDENEQIKLHRNHTLMSIELLAEIHVKKPGYVNVLPAGGAGDMAQMEESYWGDYHTKQSSRGSVNSNLSYYGMKKGVSKTGTWKNRYKYSDVLSSLNSKNNNNFEQREIKNNKERMWITGFSLTKQSGELHYIDIEDGRMGSVSKQSASSIRWPNEVNTVPRPKIHKQISSVSLAQVENHGGDNTLEVTETLTKTTLNSLSRDDGGDKNDENDDANDDCQTLHQDALLVSDGFLVPGKDNGGIYIVSNPGHEFYEWNSCLAGGNGVDRLLTKLENKRTSNKRQQDSDVSKSDDTTTRTAKVTDDEDGWFYHRSVWIDLTDDGRQSVLTARAKRPSILKKPDSGSRSSGNNIGNHDKASHSLPEIHDSESESISSMPTRAQLVWLERPKPHRYDNVTGTPLDKDGLVFDPFAPKHTPWKVRVLDEGPDVMFSVADLDTTDDTIEIFASQFFSRKITLHSIKRGNNPTVVWKRVIDDRCGASFSSILANLDVNHNISTRRVIDCGSTIPTLRKGDGFSHLLVTSHECAFAQDETVDSNPKGASRSYNGVNDGTSEVKVGREEYNANSSTKLTPIDGGSLFSYRVPKNWKTQPWIRSVIATGFRVRGQLGNMINPGAPGFW